MNLIELQHALRQLRLGGIATVLGTRLQQAQAEAMAPIDLISCLVADELTRRGDRLLEKRRKQAAFRDPQKTLDLRRPSSLCVLNGDKGWCRSARLRRAASTSVRPASASTRTQGKSAIAELADFS